MIISVKICMLASKLSIRNLPKVDKLRDIRADT